MTRSDKDALSDAQLALGTACETMLASDKYQRANPMTYGGLVKRLAMLPEHGLPKMRLVPQSKLEELGRIPRSNENFQVDALEAVKRLGAGFDNRSKAVLLVRRPLLPHRTPPPPLPSGARVPRRANHKTTTDRRTLRGYHGQDTRPPACCDGCALPRRTSSRRSRRPRQTLYKS